MSVCYHNRVRAKIPYQDNREKETETQGYQPANTPLD